MFQMVFKRISFIFKCLYQNGIFEIDFVLFILFRKSVLQRNLGLVFNYTFPDVIHRAKCFVVLITKCSVTFFLLDDAYNSLQRLRW